MSFAKGIANASSLAPTKRDTSTWVRWADKETKVLRFLTDPDEILIIQQHGFVAGFDGNKRTYVCPQGLSVGSPEYRPCDLCQQGQKAREIGVGIAVIRTALPVTGPRGFGTAVYEDLLEDVEENGVITKRPSVGIVSQSLKNFWVPVGALFDKYGSLKNQDIEILRNGSDLQTSYMVLPNVPTSVDLNSYTPYLPPVEEIMSRMASKEYFDKFLYGITAPAGTPSGNHSFSAISPKPVEEDDAWGQLKSRLGGGA